MPDRENSSFGPVYFLWRHLFAHNAGGRVMNIGPSSTPNDHSSSSILCNSAIALAEPESLLAAFDPHEWFSFIVLSVTRLYQERASSFDNGSIGIRLSKEDDVLGKHALFNDCLSGRHDEPYLRPSTPDKNNQLEAIHRARHADIREDETDTHPVFKNMNCRIRRIRPPGLRNPRPRTPRRHSSE